MSLSQDVRGILLDIEGTTTPIAFVHDVLFSYARDHVREFLAANSATEDIALLREEHAVDVKEGRNPPSLTNESIAEYVEWLIALDRKSTGLKSLQGKIWRQGYLDGSLQSQVFADVAPAFERWRERGLRMSIFSSGSVLAQQLLFAHTTAGDLTPFIDSYFDTKIGKKGDAESYRKIAEVLEIPAPEILFISDVVAELDAANEAGMKTILSIRPGN
ncbi:MAG TPA: acireductone synthase, partial [Pyrinomonadaceae bacterium]